MSENRLLYDEYAAYTAKYKALYGDKTLVLMEVGSFWELYDCDQHLGADVKAVCELLGIVHTRKNKAIPEVSRTNPNMAGFPTHALDRFLRTLLDSSYRVVLVSQVTPPPNPRREVTNVLFKGDCLLDVPLDTLAVGSQYMMVLYSCALGSPERRSYSPAVRGSKAMGVALADLTTGHVVVTQQDDNSPMVMADRLRSLLCSYQPCELLHVGERQPVDGLDVRATLQAASSGAAYLDHTNVRDADIVCPRFQEHVLEQVYQQCREDSMLSYAEHLGLHTSPHALAALVYLLKVAMTHKPRLLASLCPPVLLDQDTYLRVSSNALRHLDVAGLDAILNRCSTAIGRRHFTWRLHHPYRAREPILASHDAIRSWGGKTDADVQAAVASLKKTYDLERLFRKWQLRHLQHHELAWVRTSLLALDSLCPMFSCEGAAPPQQDIRRLLQLIQDTMDCGCGAATPFRVGMYPELDALVEQRQQVAGCMQHIVATLHDRLGQGFKAEHSERDGFYLTLTSRRFKDYSERCRGGGADVSEFPVTVPSSPPETCMFSLKHCSSLTPASSSYTKLTCGVLRTLSSLDQHLGHAIQALSDQLFQDWLADTCTCVRSCSGAIVRWVQALDFSLTCHRNARDLCHHLPALGSGRREGGWVACQQLRHPIIERQDMQVRYVANDFDNRGTPGMLLYGLNASGKSSLMKAVGLNLLLAQAGMCVACQDMQLQPYHQLWTRIGHEDNIYTGKSTFLTEMSELRDILGAADQHSMVLADELCCGTESRSAIAIVAATMELLCRRRASFVFTTHLHELASLPALQQLQTTTSGALFCCRHLHVTNADGVLVFDRTLRDGSGPDTYGLEVCEHLSMPSEFLQLAHKHRAPPPHNTISPPPPPPFTRSRYNRASFRAACMVCGKEATQTHHIIPQASANKQGVLEQFAIHKNDLCNLVALCGPCHEEVHHGHLVIQGFRHTSKGCVLDWHMQQHDAKEEEEAVEAVRHLFHSEKRTIDAVAKLTRLPQSYILQQTNCS